MPAKISESGQDTSSDDEVSLIDLIKTIRDGKRIIFFTTLFFFAIGLFSYLFSAREYVSDAIMIQEQRQTGTTNHLLRQFGGGGINEMRDEGLPTSLYPDIISSADFMVEVVNHEVDFSTFGNKMSALHYFNEVYEEPLTERAATALVDYTIKLPVTLYRGVRNLFRSAESDLVLEEGDLQEIDARFLTLDRDQRRAIREVSDRFDIGMSGGLITFTMQMPDPKAAAELNHYIVEKLQDYVISYRIQKYRQNLEFVERQMEDARERYEEAQLALARFNDRNVNITTAVARTQQEDLQNRRNITYNVYNNLAQELEQARIRLQEETPAFNILQKPSLPHNVQGRSEFVLILTIFMGLVLGTFLVFIISAYKVIREHLNE